MKENGATQKDGRSLDGLTSVERCLRCVLPQSLKSMAFRDDGVCGLCVRHEQMQQQEPTTSIATTGDINEVIERIRRRGRGKPYDCVVGLSGGRDSSFLLYLLAKEHGLRCLAAYYRTPFTHDVIDRNVRRMTDRLGVKLVEIDLSQDRHRKIARYYCKLWQKHPEPVVVNLACLVCKFAFRGLFRVARQQHVTSIVCGINRNEAAQFIPTLAGGGLMKANRALSFWYAVRKTLRILGKGIGILARCPQVARYLPLAAKASLLYLDPHTLFLRLRYPDIKCFEYFYHQAWSEAACEETIKTKLGWELPPGCWSTWRADCDFAELKNYMFYETVGATYTDTMFSNMIRGGQLSREEALRRLQDHPMFSQERLDRALEVMGLSEQFVKPQK